MKESNIHNLCDCATEPAWKLYGHSLTIKHDGKIVCGRTGKTPNPKAHGRMMASVQKWIEEHGNESSRW